MTGDPLHEFFDLCPALLFVADADGTLTRQSQALSERFSTRLEGEASLPGLAAVEDREGVGAFLVRLAEAEGPFSHEFCIPGENGAETRVRCDARRGPDGSIHGQLHPITARRDVEASRIEHVLLRTIMDTLDIVLWAVDTEGVFVFQDGKALATAGLERGQSLGMNIFELYPAELLAPIREGLDGVAGFNASEVHGVHWKSWYLPLRNEADAVEYCVGLSLDESAAVQTEHELKRQLDTISEQQRAIHELSAPLIKVWDQVLTVPLIGMMDSERTNELNERLLNEVSRSGIRFAIIDLTGVDGLDTSIASYILRLLTSLRLLGVEGMVSGISPQVAQTMVGLGIELSSIQTHRSLREALRACMETQARRQ